jgi:general secretion pathway protein A
LEETRGYIHRRLNLAGSTIEAAMQLFPDDTIERVHWHSRGIPRLINTVCENALITSFAKRVGSVVPEVIEEVALDFRLGVTHPAVREAKTQVDKSNQDALQAVKTLLQLHEYLQSMRSGGVESSLDTLPRAFKQ